MDLQTYIPVLEKELSQLMQAATKINEYEKKLSCSVTVSRVIASKKENEQWVEVKIRYRDMYVFFQLTKVFGIILEKVTPQQL